MQNLKVVVKSEKSSDGAISHKAEITDAKLTDAVTTLFSSNANVTGAYKHLQTFAVVWAASVLGSMTGRRAPDPLAPVNVIMGR